MTEQLVAKAPVLALPSEAPAEPEDKVAGAAAAYPRSQAAETRRLYAADWMGFATWCRQERQTDLPAAPASVAAYLASLSRSPGALARCAAAIADRHRRAGHPLPGEDNIVRTVLRAARNAPRLAGAATALQHKVPVRPRKRTIITPAQLTRMAARCPADLAGLRDQALLLLRAAGIDADRLLALDREHVQLSSHQVQLTLAAPVGGAGDVIILARGATRGTCPVRAMDSWLHSSDTRFGPVFRKVDRWGNVEHRRLRADALRRIWKRRAGALRGDRLAARDRS
ncbi:MAG: hypothetical protein ACRYHQ_41415 [Janthinobacterium lividum]